MSQGRRSGVGTDIGCEKEKSGIGTEIRRLDAKICVYNNTIGNIGSKHKNATKNQPCTGVIGKWSKIIWNSRGVVRAKCYQTYKHESEKKESDKK